jgi:micrococcal nuclease
MSRSLIRQYLPWLVIFLLVTPLHAEDFTGKVVGITDGDTIDVLHGEITVRVRLYGIDCPENSQSYGRHAKQSASEHAFKKEVTIQQHGRDGRGRILGDVLLPDGKILNEEFVKEGWCWWYRKYARHSGTL